MAVKNLDREEVSDLLKLTQPQKKAWKKLERAVAECNKEKIYFYQVLTTLGALNGNNVQSVDSEECTCFEDGGPRDLNVTQGFPTVEITDAWADDTHVVTFKGESGFRKY